MVVIKAHLQKIIRRFTVPDGVAINDLKAKLIELFPELQETSPDSLALYYRDSDNDVVSVSSNEELQTAVELLPGDGDKTLKLLIGIKTSEKKSEKQQTKEDSDEEDDLIDLFSQLFTPSYHYHRSLPFTSLFDQNPFASVFLFEQPSWSDRRRMLREQEERVRRRREYEEKIRKAHQEHLKEMREKAKQAEEERKTKAKSEANDGQVAETSNKPMVPQFPPGWVATPYGSWEPVVHRCPGGGVTSVWGPWGYSAHYGGDKDTKEDADQKGEQPENKKETKQEESAKPEDN